MVFLLETEMYTTQFGDLQEKNSHYSNVYEQKDYAVKQGVKWLNKRAEILKSTYKHLEDETLEEIVKNKSVVYSLKLTQIKDLRYAQNFKIPESEAGCLKVNHTHIVYNYDYKGNVINWTIEYRDPNSDFAYFMMRYPGDELVSAGLEFKVGDFVELKEEYKVDDENRVFVVNKVPVKNKPNVLFENRYRLSTINNGVLEPYWELYGGQLKKYNGNISPTSPLMLLSKMYKNEITVSEDILKKMEQGEIILNESPSFRKIKELKENF